MTRLLRSQRLRFEPIALEHVDLLVALDSDAEVMRYINGGLPTNRAEAEATIRSSIGQRWLAFDLVDSRFVGWFSLRSTDEDTYEIGYRLRREEWGHGLATEGALVLINLAFTALGARRVWAQTMSVNARSRRVMERCGLRYVRTFHAQWPQKIDGAELGDVEYELLRAAWQNGHGTLGRRVTPCD